MGKTPVFFESSNLALFSCPPRKIAQKQEKFTITVIIAKRDNNQEKTFFKIIFLYISFFIISFFFFFNNFSNSYGSLALFLFPPFQNTEIYVCFTCYYG